MGEQEYGSNRSYVSANNSFGMSKAACGSCGTVWNGLGLPAGNPSRAGVSPAGRAPGRGMYPAGREPCLNESKPRRQRFRKSLTARAFQRGCPASPGEKKNCLPLFVVDQLPEPNKELWQIDKYPCGFILPAFSIVTQNKVYFSPDKQCRSKPAPDNRQISGPPAGDPGGKLPAVRSRDELSSPWEPYKSMTNLEMLRAARQYQKENEGLQI